MKASALIAAGSLAGLIGLTAWPQTTTLAQGREEFPGQRPESRAAPDARLAEPCLVGTKKCVDMGAARASSCYVSTQGCRTDGLKFAR